MARGLQIHPWVWTVERERAAQLVADGQVTVAEIARQCGVNRDAIQAWKRCPEFGERVQEHLDRVRAKLARRGEAIKTNRIYAKLRRLHELNGLINDRGSMESHQKAPGSNAWRKGIQAKKVKMLGSGDVATIVEEYEIDTAILAEIRAIEDSIADELGERKKKADMDVTLTVADVLRGRIAKFEADEAKRNAELEAPEDEPAPDKEDDPDGSEFLS